MIVHSTVGTVAPEAFSPVPNAWGLRGATTAKLAALTVDELRDALAMATITKIIFAITKSEAMSVDVLRRERAGPE